MIRLLTALLLLVAATVARADPLPWVRFNSLDASSTILDAYFFRSPTPGPHPAVVFLHGCGGLIEHGHIESREGAWAASLTAAGYDVLMVDSFTPRGVSETCEFRHQRPDVSIARPYDAYAALIYLQMQPDVIPGRIGLMGWSAGGGALLDTIRATDAARPPGLLQDFEAAVAFYPARCNTRRQGAVWSSGVPLLVLVGAEDVWTRAAACQELIATAGRGESQASIVVYPNAFHDFDFPATALVRRPTYTTAAGVVPIQGTDPAARADAFQRVPAFLGQMLMRQ